MRLKEIKNILNCKNFTNDKFLEKDINHCYAADMMSDVLKSCKTGSLLITGLVNSQVVQVSEIMDLRGIVFVNGKEPGSDIILKAEEKCLPLLTTERQMFDACGILFSNGLSSSETQKMSGNEF